MTDSRLIPTRTPKDPAGLVLVLHGGASRRDSAMVSPTQLSVLRMVPVANELARTGGGELAVYRLLNTHRGWDSHHTPVDDVRWALDDLAGRGPLPPVCLVGHSLGGRAALLAGDRPGVAGVVALNPWVYPTDDADLGGRRVLIVHGSADRIASPARSTAVARTLARRTETRLLLVEGGKHAMLARHRTFATLTSDFVLATLLGHELSRPLSAARVDPDAAGPPLRV